MHDTLDVRLSLRHHMNPSFLLSRYTKPLRGRERSESPDVLHQRHRIDKPTRPESTDEENHPDLGNLSPSADKCKTLSLREGSHSLFPETWTQRYGNKGSLVHLAQTGQPEYVPRNLELHRGSLYIYFEDYHGSGPVNSLAAQLHDRYHLSGAYGYLIC